MRYTAIYPCPDENNELLNVNKVIWALDILKYAFLLLKWVFEIKIVNTDSEKSKNLKNLSGATVRRGQIVTEKHKTLLLPSAGQDRCIWNKSSWLNEIF